jgi:hypothetical protein
MTSSAARSDLEKSRSLRADAYFQKQVDYDAFLKIGEVIQELLK